MEEVDRLESFLNSGGSHPGCFESYSVLLSPPVPHPGHGSGLHVELCTFVYWTVWQLFVVLCRAEWLAPIKWHGHARAHTYASDWYSKGCALENVYVSGCNNHLHRVVCISGGGDVFVVDATVRFLGCCTAYSSGLHGPHQRGCA